MLSSSSVPTETGGSAPAAPRSRLPFLDGLRLVAALMVLGFHYISGSSDYWHVKAGDPAFPVIHVAAAYGWMGVNLFFIISGFVICMSSWGRSLGEFFVSRVVRLYPAFWFGVCFTSVVVTLIPTAGRHRLPLSQIFANLTMFPGALGAGSVDSVYWTLWYEVLFYLMFAIVVWRGVNYRRVVLFCVLWTTASIISSAVNVPQISAIVDQEYSMYFVAGVAMYLMRRFKPTALLWSIVGFSLLRALHMIGERLTAINQIASESQNWFVGAGLVVVFFVLVLGIALGWFDRINWRWLVPAGAMTYPLYLVHGVAGFVVINKFSTRVPKVALLIGLTGAMLLIAWLCNRLIERPASRLLRRGLVTSLRELRRDEAPAAVAPAVETPAVETPAGVGGSTGAQASADDVRVTAAASVS